jgi:hypothetical protein
MIYTPEEAGFEGKLFLGRHLLILKNSSFAHPRHFISTGRVKGEEFLWYHPENEDNELYWLNKDGVLYKMLFCKEEEEWLHILLREKEKLEFIDVVFDYIDNGGDKDEVKRKIKKLLS